MVKPLPLVTTPTLPSAECVASWVPGSGAIAGRGAALTVADGAALVLDVVGAEETAVVGVLAR